jgi:outer membrane protein assembly factor BamE (lipoprotein component of BamABCDE complex)
MFGIPRNKEIGAMRIGAIVFIATAMLFGCAHLDINKNAKALSQIKPGDPQEEVFRILGTPDLRHDINDQRVVAFYQTTPGRSANAPVTEDLCTPIAFENGNVVAVGEDLTAQWTREEEARKHQAELAAQQRQQEERARAALRQAEAARQEKIRALEDRVRPIPASKIALNLKLYRQLHELDPNNPRYQKKVAFYEEHLVMQDNARKQRALRLEKARQREVWEKARETRNIMLRQYSGNGTAEMAVHDMGNGSLYVWIKNVSRQIITTHPDYFTLIDSDNQKMRCEISDSLDSVLEPGSISHGKIEYDKSVIPKELIFENRESGRISKSFE